MLTGASDGVDWLGRAGASSTATAATISSTTC